MSSEAQKRASAKYQKANCQRVHLSFNKKTDMDILEKLSAVSSMQGYIKELIRRDLGGTA